MQNLELQVQKGLCWSSMRKQMAQHHVARYNKDSMQPRPVKPKVIVDPCLPQARAVHVAGVKMPACLTNKVWSDDYVQQRSHWQLPVT